MSLRPDPLWYKDAIIYELHVRAFYDSVTDGMGDFAGLTQKLDYLEELGVTALWLLPFCPSPWRDDGYDIADYTDVHPAYGSLKDFQRFLREAHRRGLRVITELVLNHTSDQHEWFQRSRRAEPGSKWRNYYVWSDSPELYKEARIIFKDFESSNWSWDPVAKAYYWHRFYSHQPDLNWDNPEVKQAMFQVLDFWFDLGVDGLRLDAVPYLIERENTNCENLTETHDILKEVRKHVDSKYEDRMLLAEANQWPEDSVAYFGNGDECNMAFHFPVMPRLFMSLRMEDRYPITDIMKITPSIPENCQWAMFLRNHDELTLEMVTDEERDYMYRMYANDRTARINLGIRRRLAPLLENDRRRIELMNALLLSLPGTPVIYYGDEIGMGDNIYLGDRNGVRTPMQWSSDRNAGFSRANPQKLYLPVIIDPEYHYEAVNVEAQSNNPHSLLWWMRRMIAQRKQHQAFGRGTLEFVYPQNRKVLAFVRVYEEERVLVIANLSRFTQCVELDLGKYKDSIPIEMFGHSKFPSIGEQKYFMSLGPYAFHWFVLQQKEATVETSTPEGEFEKLPRLLVRNEDEVFAESTLGSLSRQLPRLMKARTWFPRKRRAVTSAEIIDSIPVTANSRFLLVRVEYSDGEPESFTMPISLAIGEAAENRWRDTPESVFLRIEGLGQKALLYGAVYDPEFASSILTSIIRRKRFGGDLGELVGAHGHIMRKALSQMRSDRQPITRGDIRNTVLQYGEDFVLKLYRRVEPGTHPEKEMYDFLTQAGFPNISPSVGSLEFSPYGEEEVETTVLGLLTRYSRNTTNGWNYALDHLGLFFERALALPEDNPEARDLRSADPLTLSTQPVPRLIAELLGTDLEMLRVLGTRTAQMHKALSSRYDVQEFAPEPFTDFYRHGLYHGMAGQVSRTIENLRSRLPGLAPSAQEEVRRLLQREPEMRDRFRGIRETRISGARIRHHGDLHVGNIAFTGNDVTFINFEGNSDRPLSERRIKRSSLRDVASMIRSFDYVSHAALYGEVPGVIPSRGSVPQLERWAQLWSNWVSAVFLRAYLDESAGTNFAPKSEEEVRVLLTAYLLEKALIEIEYEIEFRPDWVRIPLQGISEQLNYRAA